MPLFAKNKKEVKDLLLLNAITPSIIEHPGYLEVDEDLCRVITFTKFPERVDVGWADRLYQQPNMAVCIHCEPFEDTELLDSVDTHASQLDGMLGQRRMKASEINEYEREMRQGEEILNLFGDESERFFNTTISAVIRASDLNSLDRETRHFRSSAASGGMKFLNIRHDQLSGFLASSPLCIPNKTMTERGAHPMQAKTIGYAKPAVSPGLDDGVGITIGSDSNNGTVRLNIVETSEDRLNRNINVFAEMGGGKTTLVMKLLEREFFQYGSKLIILDPEGEYRQLVRSLGGEIIKMGAVSAAKLSPLQPRAVIFTENDEEDDNADDNASAELVLLSTIPFVKSWFKRSLNIADEHMNCFEIALEHAYGKYGIDKRTTFADYMEKNLSYPIMVDIYDSLNELKSTDSERSHIYDALAQAIYPFAKGIYEHLWNTRTSINLNSKVIDIDTSDMQSDETMMAAQYYNVLSWIWSEIRLNPSSGSYIRVVADEITTIVNPRMPEAALMYRNMAKRIRKRLGGLTSTTQEPNDLLHEEVRIYGAAVANNATYTFLGYAKAENLEQMARIYKLDSELAKKLERAKRGEFAVIAGTSDRTWVRVECADWEFELFGKKRDE